MPAPFDLVVAVTENDPQFITALGRVDQTTHPLFRMWVALSPIRAIGKGDYCHVCAFTGEPPIPIDLETLIRSAPLKGFASATLVSD